MFETIINDDSKQFIQKYFFFMSLVHLHNIIDNILPVFQCILHICFSYNMYIIENKETKIKIMKNIKNYYCYCYDENKDPTRMIVEKMMFPSYFIYTPEINYELIYIFSNKNTYEELIKEHYSKKEIALNDEHVPLKSIQHDNTYDNNCQEILNQNAISYLSFSGSYGHFYINERMINLSKIHDLEWYEYQLMLFKNIMEFYKKNNYCKIFLNGPPGTGKTFFAYLMAQKLNCYLTDTYNPCDPGSSLNTCYHRAKKISPNKPLIIVLDEVDVLLNKIHNQKIPNHKHYKSEVYDKVTWNQFLDKVSYGLYPYLIVLFISNQKKEQIDMLDKAYFRKGRVDIFDKW